MTQETLTTRFQIFINLNLPPILNHIALKSCPEKRHIFLLRKEKSSYNKLKKFSYAFRRQLKRNVSLDYVGTFEHIGTETSMTSMQISSDIHTYRLAVSNINFYLHDLFNMIQVLIVDSIKTFTNSSHMGKATNFGDILLILRKVI